MILDDATTINGIRVPLRAIRFHAPPHVHRSDRPSRALAIWTGIAIATWLLALVRVW